MIRRRRASILLNRSMAASNNKGVQEMLQGKDSSFLKSKGFQRWLIFFLWCMPTHLKLACTSTVTNKTVFTKHSAKRLFFGFSFRKKEKWEKGSCYFEELSSSHAFCRRWCWWISHCHCLWGAVLLLDRKTKQNKKERKIGASIKHCSTMHSSDSI